MSFDDGRPVRIGRVPRSLEYSASAGTTSEYDVAADNPRFDPLAYQTTRTVERTFATEVCVCGPIVEERPRPVAAPPITPAEILPAPPSTAVPPSKTSAFTQRQLRELVGDKQLLADIESILDKKPEAPKPEPANRPEPRPAPPMQRQEPTEHEIFARIAKNMQYATAYDLGSVELGRRFDAFDQPEPQLPVARRQGS